MMQLSNKKPAIASGFIPSRSRSSAVNGLPSLERFVISGFPVSQYRGDLKTWLKIERERCFVLETDVYSAIIRGERQFHVGNDLAFDLREVENFPYSAGAGSFIGSHVASRKGDLVRAVFVLQHGCGSLPL